MRLTPTSPSSPTTASSATARTSTTTPRSTTTRSACSRPTRSSTASASSSSTAPPIADAPKGPFNIELFAGSPDDNNATFFWNGAIDTLQPLIDDGTLVVKSGQTDFQQAATLRWDGEVAQSRMEDILTTSYSDGSKVNAVLSPYDGLSRGIISALTDAGYTVGDGWPIISGQDAELDSVKAINSGEQYATIFKDTRELAKVAVDMATALLNGDKPEVNNTEDYDNGKKVVPSYLLESQIVVKDNINEVLVDSGYWTEAEING